MRPADFFVYLEAMNARLNDKIRHSAELIRLQTTTLVNVQLKKEDQLKPTDLWHFDWDNENSELDASANSVVLSEEEIQAHNLRLSAMI